MIDVCPVCKAANPGTPACRRCKADLTLCVAVLQQRERLIAEAWTALKKNQLDLAQQLADRAGELGRSPDVEKLSAVIALLRRDFQGALREYRVATIP